MRRLRPDVRLLFRLTRPGDAEAVREVDEEVRLHIELRAEALVRQGIEPELALEEARRRFARNEDTLRALYRTAMERNRRMRMRERWDSWRRDARYATRALARDRASSLFAVVTLALGMGASVTAFSLVDRLLLRDPPHIEAPGELVRLYGTVNRQVSGDVTSSWIPYPAYRQLREGFTTLTNVSGYRVTVQTVGTGIAARRLRVGQTLDGFFATLGTRPRHGRFFLPGEDPATAGNVAVVSHRLWWEDFGGDPSVIGRSLVVGEGTHTIVGVAPEGFTGTELRRVDVWVLGDTRTAGQVNWKIVGRRRPGAPVHTVSEEAAAVHARLGEGSPQWFRDAVISAGPIRLDDSGEEPLEVTLSRWLVAISAMILLVAVGNVANLLLARLARRRRELAVRVALGSGRGHVLRLISVEGLLLAVCAGGASLAVVQAIEPVVRETLFGQDAPWTGSLVNGRVLLALVAVVIVTAVALGALPAQQAGSFRLTSILRSNPHAGAPSTRTRAALIVLQAALSVVLLVGAGLFLRSMSRVNAVDLGVDEDRVVSVEIVVPWPAAEDFEAYQVKELEVFRRAREAVGRLPGVERVAIAVGPPLDGGSYSAAVYVPGRDSVPVLPGGGPFASAVGPGYFETVGTRLLRGRTFTDLDNGSAEPVLIVNETMAAALWPGGTALRNCARIARPTSPCARIVGVVADVHRVGLRDQPSLQYYLPLEQQKLFGGAKLLVRSRPWAGVSWPVLRQTMLEVEPSARAVEVRPLSQALDGELRPLRLGVVAFGLTGTISLVVAVLGLYSVMAYIVAWRTREIGVRAALGATGTQIGRLVIANGAALAAAGVAAGLVLAAIGGRWIAPHLFETSAADPLVLGGVTVTLMAVAVVAGWVPAQRAARISPTEALRAE